MTLYLLRHAKSSWDDPALTDEQRPLNARGRREAQQLRRHFERIDLQVELVLVSPAQRTRETWAAVADGVGGDPDVRFEPDVYDASYHDLARLLGSETADTIMLVGHNPGVEDLVAYLTGAPVQPVPTGGFVTLETNAGSVPGSARLIDFVGPRGLPS